MACLFASSIEITLATASARASFGILYKCPSWVNSPINRKDGSASIACANAERFFDGSRSCPTKPRIHLNQHIQNKTRLPLHRIGITLRHLKAVCCQHEPDFASPNSASRATFCLSDNLIRDEKVVQSGIGKYFRLAQLRRRQAACARKANCIRAISAVLCVLVCGRKRFLPPLRATSAE